MDAPALLTPLTPLLDGRERIFWGYLLASAGLALGIALVRRESWSGQRLRAYFGSADARLDGRYFIVHQLIRVWLLVPLVLSVDTVARGTLDLLGALADPPYLPWPYRWIVLAYTFALFVAGDLSRYALHRLLHRNRWLWAFHKVHHSAEALNPLTFYRVHPLENALFALRNAVVTGIVTGAFVFCFGTRLDVYALFGGNLFVVVLFAFTGNLRHSHIRLGYGRWLERLFVSPAQHQIHHDVRHLQRNFGSALAIWDWLFGTLRCTHEVGGALRFGLGRGRRQHYDGVCKLLGKPFLDLPFSRNFRPRRASP